MLTLLIVLALNCLNTNLLPVAVPIVPRRDQSHCWKIHWSDFFWMHFWLSAHTSCCQHACCFQYRTLWKKTVAKLCAEINVISITLLRPLRDIQCSSISKHISCECYVCTKKTTGYISLGLISTWTLQTLPGTGHCQTNTVFQAASLQQ